MDDEHDIPVDPDLREVWADMDPAERIQLLLAEGEPPPSEVSERARQAYRDHRAS